MQKSLQKRCKKKVVHCMIIGSRWFPHGSLWCLICCFESFCCMVTSPFKSLVSLSHLLAGFCAKTFRLFFPILNNSCRGRIGPKSRFYNTTQKVLSRHFFSPMINQDKANYCKRRSIKDEWFFKKIFFKKNKLHQQSFS